VFVRSSLEVANKATAAAAATAATTAATDYWTEHECNIYMLPVYDKRLW